MRAGGASGMLGVRRVGRGGRTCNDWVAGESRRRGRAPRGVGPSAARTESGGRGGGRRMGARSGWDVGAGVNGGGRASRFRVAARGVASPAAGDSRWRQRLERGEAVLTGLCELLVRRVGAPALPRLGGLCLYEAACMRRL
ncbi:hypothetical protein SLA2020_446120 [Shorea laevis]